MYLPRFCNGNISSFKMNFYAVALIILGLT